MRWAQHGVAGAVVVGIALAAACGGDAFTAGPGSGSDAGHDGPTIDGPSLDGPGGGDGPTIGDSAIDAPAGSIVYVAPTGIDLRTGYDPTLPKRTIGSALIEAALHPEIQTIEVCAGTYTETRLTFSANVSLKGAYDCKTWTRTATYGFPKFDGVNETTIGNADPTVQGATLQVAGDVTSATVIDGFTIQGASPSTVESTGLRVTGSASPLVSNDVIGGGAGQNGTTGIGSHGVLIDGAAAPEVTGCAIAGGSGVGSMGSVGIYSTSTGDANIHGDVVSGGTGTSTVTGNLSAVGVGLHASLTSAHPLTQMIISGTDLAGANGETAGVYVDGVGTSGVSAVVSGCTIAGGYALGNGVSSAGVRVNSPGGAVVVSADRIYGGATTGSTTQTLGVLVAAAGTLLVADSIVHAGTVPDNTGNFAVGVDLNDVSAPQVFFDTIYSGGAAGTGIALNAGVVGAAMTDDLLLGSDSALGSYAVAATACSGMINALDYTAFTNVAVIYECGGGGGVSMEVATTIPEMQADVMPAVTNNDLVLASSCTGAVSGCGVESGCPGAGSVCPLSIFGNSWSAGDDGICSALGVCSADAGVPADGWTLAAGSPCALTQEGSFISTLPTDLYGKTRHMPPSMGAAEYEQSANCK